MRTLLIVFMMTTLASVRRTEAQTNQRRLRVAVYVREETGGLIERPNKPLKLTGADRSKGSGVLCPWRDTDCRPLLLRRRAGRPQKRDPLGGVVTAP